MQISDWLNVTISYVMFQSDVTLDVNKQSIALTLVIVYVECEIDELIVYV